MFNYKAYLLNSIFQYHTSPEDSNIHYKNISTILDKVQLKKSTKIQKVNIDSPKYN
jgi:hypothetical protein